MRFMNTYEIDEASSLYAHDPILGPATATLANLRDAADANSDGWAYWPKPARAAAQLMEVIERARMARYRFTEETVSADDVRRAMRPIKSFRTRSGLAFEIFEPSND